MTRVFITRKIPQNGVDTLRDAGYTVDVWPGALPPPDDVLRQEATASDAMMTLVTDTMDATLMDGAPNLKVISNAAVGVDNIDLSAATARGVFVGHTPGVLTEATADLAFSLLMAAARRLAEAERDIKAGKWQTWEPVGWLGYDIHGATLGVVGFGRIGQAVARRGQGFGMKLLYANRSERPEAAAIGAARRELDDLLRESDFVSLNVPLNASTEHLIGERELKLMKPTAILVNTARGAVVDQNALETALRNGEIAGAGLDVTDPEPLPPDHSLLTLENCLITPHIGSATHASRGRMVEIAAQNIIAGINGDRLPHCANPDVYKK